MCSATIQLCKEFTILPQMGFAGQAKVTLIAAVGVRYSLYGEEQPPENRDHRSTNHRGRAAIHGRMLPDRGKRALARQWKTYGGPGEIRTPDLTVRSRSLHPTELRAHT